MKMLFLIHTCKEREWYVREFLIPSMTAQGIPNKNILVYSDTDGDGLLTSFIKSYDLIKGRDAWHLQDDIIISKHFKNMAQDHDRGLVCGFCNSFSRGHPGYVSLEVMWYSMPCIRIPDEIMGPFIGWLNNPAIRKKFAHYFNENKHDDVFLEMFLKQNYPKLLLWNVAPNMVNHIDHLLGGSLVNKDRNKDVSYIMSKYWDEPELLTNIENKLKERRELK